MNLWATAAQAAVYSVVSISVGMYYKRTIKRDRERLDRMLSGVEAVFGIATNPDLIIKETKMGTLQQYRKAIAAGLGVILIGALTWLAQAGVLASLLDPIMPASLKPLIGVLAGGIATIVAVIKTTNHPAPVEADAADVPAVEVSTATTASPVLTNASTGSVDLLPAPEPSYL